MGLFRRLLAEYDQERLEELLEKGKQFCETQ